MRRAFALPLILWMMSPVAIGAEPAQPISINLACTADLTLQRSLTIKASQQDITTATKVVERAEGLTRFSADANASYYRLNAPVTLQSKTIPVDGTSITIPGQVVADQNSPTYEHCIHSITQVATATAYAAPPMGSRRRRTTPLTRSSPSCCRPHARTLRRYTAGRTSG